MPCTESARSPSSGRSGYLLPHAIEARFGQPRVPARVILKEPDRPGRPHPAVPATFSRQAGEAVIRPCPTLVRHPGRFALPGCQLCPCLHALSASEASSQWGLAPTSARCLSPILTRLAGEAVQTTSITLGNARKNRPGRPHPAVPATFSRQAGEAVIRPCPTLIRLTGRFALQGHHYAHVYTRDPCG